MDPHDEEPRTMRAGTHHGEAEVGSAAGSLGVPDPCTEFRYCLPWWEFLGRLPFGMILLLGLPWYGMWVVMGDDAWQTTQIATMIAALLATGAVIMVQLYRIVRLVMRRRGKGRAITLGASMLEAPQQALAPEIVHLPLGEITRLCLLRHWCELILHVETSQQRLCVPDSAFGSSKEWMRFLETLAGVTGLPIERRQQRCGQFSLSALLVVTGLVALIFGLNSSVHVGHDTTGLLIWRGLMLVAGFSALAVLLATVPRVGRPTASHLFGMAYAVGCIWELAASRYVLQHLTGPELPPIDRFYAWYPLTFPLTRLGTWFVPPGFNIQPEHFLAAGAVISGLLFGLAALYGWKALRRWHGRPWGATLGES